jgi:hypothetical protein
VQGHSQCPSMCSWILLQAILYCANTVRATCGDSRVQPVCVPTLCCDSTYRWLDRTCHAGRSHPTTTRSMLYCCSKILFQPYSQCPPINHLHAILLAMKRTHQNCSRQHLRVAGNKELKGTGPIMGKEHSGRKQQDLSLSKR